MKTLELETKSYDERRYGKPWIARVEFIESPKGEYQFGIWIGEAGHPGLLQVDVKPGDIIAKGRKDFRKPQYSTKDFHIVRDDYTIDEDAVMSFGTAFKLWRETKSKSDEGYNEKLLAEKAELLDRLAEIELSLEKK